MGRGCTALACCQSLVFWTVWVPVLALPLSSCRPWSLHHSEPPLSSVSPCAGGTGSGGVSELPRWQCCYQASGAGHRRRPRGPGSLPLAPPAWSVSFESLPGI